MFYLNSNFVLMLFREFSGQNPILNEINNDEGIPETGGYSPELVEYSG